MKTAVFASLLAGAAFNSLAVTLPPAPVARNDSYELTGLTLAIDVPGMLANDSGTGVSVSSYFNPAAGTLNRVVADGSFLYTPAPGFAGTTSFSYFIRDTYDRSAIATVTIDASTTLPRARDDHYTLAATTLEISAPGLLANDSGGIGTVNVSSYFDPATGTLNRVVADGSFQYTPERGFAGVASFSYFTLDELGRSANANVFIDAGASIPVAFDDSFAVRSGATLDISAPGLLANDRGGIGEVIVASYFDPASGTLERVVSDGSFRYRADPGFVGTTSFQYATLDELGRSSTAFVSIDVTAVPEPGTWLMLLGGLAILGLRGRGPAAVVRG